MLGISITSIGFIALLITGTSGLVMNPGHRRHAANVNLLGDRDSQPVALLPRQIMAERRSTRQKRCVRQHMSSDSLTPSPAVGSDAPANVAPTPTPDQTTTSSSEQQIQPTSDVAQPTPDVTSVTSNGSGGDTFSGQLT